MLVDNPMMQQPSSLFADSSNNSNNNNNNSGLTDLEEFLNTELFGPSSSTFTTAMSPGASTSRASSPSDSTSQLLSTPPQAPLENSFPPVQVQMDPYSFLGNVNSDFGFGGGMGLGGGFGSGAGFGAGTAAPSFFNFLDEEIKVDPSMSAFSPFDPPSTGGTGLPYDFLSAFGGPGGATTASTSSSSAMAIDPQLVGSPSAHAPTSISDEEMDVAQVQEQEPEPEPEPVATKKATRSSTKASAASKPTPTAEEKDDKPTLTIAPVKVGGHGKARKGTVQGGGITKKVAVPAATSAPIVPLALPIPTSTSSSSSSSSPINVTSSFFPSSSSSFPSTLSGNKENNFSSSASSTGTRSDKGDDKDIHDDDDDLPADWRPPPEVLAKMTSKEKRQLRNKISARNFRVRRKEYISTLEMDIAERDRLLQAIRSELGSTQSENLALRQEVATLKRALLGRNPTNSASSSAGAAPLSPTSLRSSSTSPTPMLTVRGSDVNLNSAAVTLDDLNLPPPAPLPERSAAEELAARAQAQAAAAAAQSSSSSSSLLAPNKRKDLPTSPRLNSNSSAFWGGLTNHHSAFGAGGGYTPVHTVLMPDLNMHTEANLSIGQWVRDVVAAQAASAAAANPQFSQERELQENMNPIMNQQQGQGQQQQQQRTNNGQGGFDGFVDTNPFTMKTLDAYRMHFWSKMAASASQQASTNSPPSMSQQQQYLAAAQAQAQQQQQQYAQQRKALERESLSPSPFTLPSHQSGASIHPSGHGITTLNGLASSLKPAYFVNSNKINLPLPSTTVPRLPISNTLSALLAGKHSTSSAFGSSFVGANANTHSHPASYPSPPSSPNLSGKILSRSGSQQQQMPSPSSSSSTPQQLTPAQMQQAQNAMYAAALASTASQTLLGKLGGAFWDAFSGSSHPGSSAGSGIAGSSSSSQSHNGAGAKPWDADKVRKVLEGKAVVRVVDVDDLAQMKQMKQMKAEARIPATTTTTTTTSGSGSGCGSECSMTAILEESMRSLTLAKK